MSLDLYIIIQIYGNKMFNNNNKTRINLVWVLISNKCLKKSHYFQSNSIVFYINDKNKILKD